MNAFSHIRDYFYLATLITMLSLTALGMTYGESIAGVLPAALGGGTIPPGGTVPPAPPPVPATGQVNIIHLAPFDAVIADTAVEIRDQSDNVVNGIDDLKYLEQSGYFHLTTGNYAWKAVVLSTNVEVFIPPFQLNDGAVLTLLLTGDDSNQPLSSLLIVEQLGKPTIYLPLIVR